MTKLNCNFLLSAVLAASAWCAPAYAHNSKSDYCQQALLLQGTILQHFEDIETWASDTPQLLAGVPRKFIAAYNLEEKILGPVQAIQSQARQALENWQPDDTSTLGPLSKALTNAKRRLVKLKTDAVLWSQRYDVGRAGDFAAIRENSFLLLPDVIYTVNAERGGVFKVRFSPKVVEEFFWEDIDNTIRSAAEHAVRAVARGYQPPSSKGASGIATLTAAIGGEVVYKIVIVGMAFGAHRVYGLARNGVIGFVTHESSCEHDSRYLRRACDRAINSYKVQPWH